jgi:BirA family biotin operon repressor/biotin-[acetyl-CoA-carboxylase] ligase
LVGIPLVVSEAVANDNRSTLEPSPDYTVKADAIGMNQQKTGEQILRLFHDHAGEYLSGERISRELGVSRTAIWKRIEQLRSLGYRIEAVPSRGYCLASTPDILLPEEIRAGLDTRRIGCEVLFYSSTDSTNDRAHELAQKGAPEGTVVVADCQSSGKGRLGRRWESPPGVNLYASVVLRPAISPYHAAQLTFLSAAAVARSVADCTGLVPAVKWPNDVLLGGRKVAGLLNELDAETERVHYLILGIGVNLNMQPDQFPSDLRYPATSLAIETGRRAERLAFTRTLLRNLDRLYDLYLEQGFGPVLPAWQEFFDMVGQEVEVDCQEYRLRGRVTGLDGNGALLLRLADGSERRVLSGDVRPL